jgi:nitronate monooxygenase
MTGATLRDRLGIDVPILQAPMAGSQGSALAIAASNAGALGALPCAMLGPDALRAELATLTAGTTRPYQVNFFCHVQPAIDPRREAAWRAVLAPRYAEFGIVPEAVAGGPLRLPFGDEAAEVLEAFRPPVVSFHFGLPSPALLARVKRWGALVLSSATTVAEARWLEARGVDAVIAQGLEAGGHRGHFLSDDLAVQSGSFALLPQVVRAVRVPVIAAGGIADAAGVAAAFALGASAVQVGTAFLLCPEASTGPHHRAALAAAPAGSTALTRVFTGRPARGIVNRAMRELGADPAAIPDFPLATGAIAPLRAAAEALGSGEFSPLWAGQNTTGCRAVPAADLIRALAAGVPDRIAGAADEDVTDG